MRYRPGGKRTAALTLYRIAGYIPSRERDAQAAEEQASPWWDVVHEWKTREGLRVLTLQPRAEPGPVRAWAEGLAGEWDLDVFVENVGWWGDGRCIVEFREKG